MKKIAMLRCLKTSASCAGAGCLRALYEKDKAFAQYGDEELSLMAMWTCYGCGDSMLENQECIKYLNDCKAAGSYGRCFSLYHLKKISRGRNFCPP